MTPKPNTRRAARRLFRLCLVDGLLDEQRVRQVAAALAASGRRGSLAVLGGLLRLVRLYVARHTAVVESPVALPPDVQDALRAQLTGRYGPGVETTFTSAPALLAGVRVRIGSDVYDGSVRARLSALEARL